MTLVLRDSKPSERIAAGPGFYTQPRTEEGGFWEAAGAGYANENSIASWVADLEFQTEAEDVDGYDQYQDIPEDLADMPLATWRGVRSPEEMQGRIAEVKAENERLATMATNGWGAFFGGMSGILTSPEIIPDLFVGRGAGVVKGAVKLGASSLAAEAVHEAIMHEQNYTRTKGESYVNMSLALFGGAAVGGFISRKASTDALNFMRSDLEEGAEPGAFVNPDDSAGAARVAGYVDPDLGEEAVKKPWLRWRVLGPVRQLVHSENPVVWRGTNDLFENSYRPVKTKEGVAKQIAVETEVNQAIGARMRSVKTVMNVNYKKWLKDTGARRFRDFRKNWSSFNEEVHRALVNGDDHVDAAVKATAKSMRVHFNEMLALAKKYDPDGKWVDVDELEVKFADSYAPRRYNRRLIQKKPTAFRRALTEAFTKEKQRLDYEEALQTNKDAKWEDYAVTDQAEIDIIKGKVEKSFQRIAYGYDQDIYMPIGAAGKAWKARKITMRDNDLLDGKWLESNIESMMRSYSNRVLKPVGMIKNGYDPELSGFIKEMDDSFEAAVKGLDDAEANKLGNRHDRERETVELLRDRFYGRTTISSSNTAESVNDFLRTVRNFNVSRMMGMVLPISIGDVFRANMTAIYAPELGVLAPGLLNAIKTAKRSKKIMQKFGIAHETATMIKAGKVFDDSGLEGTSRAVELSALASRGLMKGTGLMAWTDWGKLLAASYTQNDIAQKMLGYGKLKARARTQLADLGIDEKTAKAFQEEMKAAKKSGAIETLGKNHTGYDGVGYVFDYAKFQNQELADRISSVLFRESERNIITPAVGEVPRLTQSDEVNKMIFQFQNFLFGAAHSVTVNLGKRMRDRDPKGFQLLTQLMLGGAVSVSLRESFYGNFEALEGWTPQDWVLNSMDYASISPLFMMAFNKINLGTGNQLVNQLGATSMSRYAHRPLGSFAGPSIGTAEDSLVAIQSLIGIPFGDQLSPSDIRRLRRLIPWNNYMFIAAPMSAASEAIEEGL